MYKLLFTMGLAAAILTSCNANKTKETAEKASTATVDAATQTPENQPANSATDSKDNPDFRAQVEWELCALAECDYIILYLDPDTQSPISLLEMGLYAQSGKLFVVCPLGFWRKGNVDIVCEKYGFPQFASLELLIAHIRLLLSHISLPVAP